MYWQCTCLAEQRVRMLVSGWWWTGGCVRSMQIESTPSTPTRHLTWGGGGGYFIFLDVMPGQEWHAFSNGWSRPWCQGLANILPQRSMLWGMSCKWLAVYALEIAWHMTLRAARFTGATHILAIWWKVHPKRSLARPKCRMGRLELLSCKTKFHCVYWSILYWLEP